jgi:hypothetical protein
LAAVTGARAFHESRIAAAVAAACLLASFRASADPPAPTAESLFDEAKALAQAGRWPEACPKLARSQQLEPNMVTLYRLADCEEHVARFASAWSHYVEAASLAKASGSAQRYEDAIARANALQPRLGRVRVVVEQPANDERVTCDGATIAPELWGTEIPMDAGAHVILARAPGRVEITRRVAVTDGVGTSLTLPALDLLPPPPPAVASTSPVASQAPRPPTAAGPESSAWSPLRSAGVAVGAAGVLAMGASVILGFVAKNKDERAAQECPATGCNPDGKSLNDDARRLGNIGTGVFFAGAIAIAAGVVLWVAGANPRTSRRGDVAWTF